jgi:hypothetical protein
VLPCRGHRRRKEHASRALEAFVPGSMRATTNRIPGVSQDNAPRAQWTSRLRSHGTRCVPDADGCKRSVIASSAARNLRVLTNERRRALPSAELHSSKLETVKKKRVTTPRKNRATPRRCILVSALRFRRLRIARVRERSNATAIQKDGTRGTSLVVSETSHGVGIDCLFCVRTYRVCGRRRGAIRQKAGHPQLQR